MKIRHLEIIKAILLSGIIASSIEITSDVEILKEIKRYLNLENITCENIDDFFRLGYQLSLITGFNLETICKDYRELERLYNRVVFNTASLMDYFEIENDPIKIFAMYVYMYRSGYLSYNKEFYYSTDMKDLSQLNGLDVIRGTGVCRSIASMFTDICNMNGLNASNVAVNVKSGVLSKKEPLTQVELNDKDEGKKFARIVGAITSVIPTANHLVTRVNDGIGAIILDSTNDIVMNMKSYGKYSFVNNKDAVMNYRFLNNMISYGLGQMNTEVNLFGLMMRAKSKGIEYDEYYHKYIDTLKIINDNALLFEDFYNYNSDIYEEIYHLADKQHGLIKRIVPIIPKIK